jgi:IclR family transcriptional regulator, KDG regulon repressor
MMNKGNTDISSVQTVDRAITLLKIIANSRSPVSLAELVEQTGLNRTTVYRLLSTLEKHDLVEREIATKGYQIGYETTRLVDGSTKYAPLIRRSLASMERLRDIFDESVLLGVPKAFQVLTIAQLNTNHSIRIVDYVNLTSPLHCSSNGKILLSTFSDEELDIFLERPLEKLTPFTITDPDELRKELQIVRERGFGTTFGELDENENGISAPIKDKDENIVAFLSIAGPGFRFTKDKVLSAALHVISTANEISKKLQK